MYSGDYQGAALVLVLVRARIVVRRGTSFEKLPVWSMSPLLTRSACSATVGAKYSVSSTDQRNISAGHVLVLENVALGNGISTDAVLQAYVMLRPMVGQPEPFSRGHCAVYCQRAKRVSHT